MGLYDPTKDSWRPMNALGAPSKRIGHLVVWSGSEALVWGGSMAQGSGSGFGWASIPPAPGAPSIPSGTPGGP